MSILIKGMEMPKNCVECPIYDSEYLHCNITNTEPWQGHEDDDVVPIPSDCPLIELPPHGRLIDADALRSLYDNNAYDADGITNEEFDKMTVSVAVIRQNIDDMPTIIEAEQKT